MKFSYASRQYYGEPVEIAELYSSIPVYKPQIDKRSEFKKIVEYLKTEKEDMMEIARAAKILPGAIKLKLMLWKCEPSKALDAKFTQSKQLNIS